VKRHRIVIAGLVAITRVAIALLLVANTKGNVAYAGGPEQIHSPAPPLPETARFRSEIMAFVEADRTNAPPPNPIVFVGSSSIRMWKTLAADFPHHRVLNRGFGGSEIRHSIDYADRIIIPYKPRQIVLYAGGNDIHAGKSPETVFQEFQEFVAKIHGALPKTRISYISIAGNPARWAEVEKVRKANDLTREFTRTNRRLDFIDVFPEMLGADGQPKPDIFVADRLHMNANGYAIWKRVITRHLLRADRK